MDIFDQMAAGVHRPLEQCTPANFQSEKELQLSYSLAKKVPDMEQRGFTIETAYGEIVIEPGRNADFIAAIVRTALEQQLKAAALARRDAQLDGVRP